MKNEIINNIDKPHELEKMYRNNKSTFKKEFNLIYPEIKNNKIASFWNERLNYETSEISWGTSKELLFVIFISLLAGLVAKLPEIIGINNDYFYTRNASFIVFPFLTIYFASKNKINIKKVVIALIANLTSMVFINLLPDNNSNSLILSCIHLPFFIWVTLGFIYTSSDLKSHHKRLNFLQYNGDLVVITSLILIAGIILAGITVGLFSLIGFNIAEFYFKYIAVIGLAASPIVGTHIIKTNPMLVNKISPVIAKIFSPLVIITLIIYLITMIFSDKDPYNDREFLLIFNSLLIGVMAIILFSVAETSRTEKINITTSILFLLSIITVIVNSIALSAIVFRILAWGLTPNRLAVLGGNILILTNLLIVTYWLLRSIKKSDKIKLVEKSIANFLPIYGIWAIIVTFIFPFIFSFK